MQEIFFDIPYDQEDKINLAESRLKHCSTGSFILKLEYIYQVSINLRKYRNNNFKPHPDSIVTKNCFTIHLKVTPREILDLISFLDTNYINDITGLITVYLFSKEDLSSGIKDMILNIPDIILDQQIYQEYITSRFK